MWYWIEGIACVLLGGWGGYALGAAVLYKGEEAYMKTKGYVKRGEDWIKSEAGKLRSAL